MNEDRETSKKKGGRFYFNPRGGDSLPSVTTIGKVFPAPQLDRWIKNRDKEEFVNWVVKNRGVLNMLGPDGQFILNDESMSEMLKALKFFDSTATDAGNLVHNIFENLLLGRTPDVPPGWECVLELFKRFTEDYEYEVIAVEPQLLNHTFEYAGSADAILNMRLRGSDEPMRITVIDWKSGSGLYGSVARQTCMYARAEFMIDPITGKEIPAPKVVQARGVWLRPSGYACKPLVIDDDVWIDCRAAIRVYRSHLRGDWHLVGRPENPNPIKSKGRDWPVLPKAEEAA